MINSFDEWFERILACLVQKIIEFRMYMEYESIHLANCGCYTPYLLCQHGAQEISTKVVEKGEQLPISTPKNEVADVLEE